MKSFRIKLAAIAAAIIISIPYTVSAVYADNQAIGTLSVKVQYLRIRSSATTLS